MMQNENIKDLTYKLIKSIIKIGNNPIMDEKGYNEYMSLTTELTHRINLYNTLNRLSPIGKFKTKSIYRKIMFYFTSDTLTDTPDWLISVLKETGVTVGVLNSVHELSLNTPENFINDALIVSVTSLEELVLAMSSPLITNMMESYLVVSDKVENYSYYSRWVVNNRKDLLNKLVRK